MEWDLLHREPITGQIWEHWRKKSQSQCKQSWALMTYISPVKLFKLLKPDDTAVSMMKLEKYDLATYTTCLVFRLSQWKRKRAQIFLRIKVWSVCAVWEQMHMKACTDLSMFICCLFILKKHKRIHIGLQVCIFCKIYCSWMLSLPLSDYMVYVSTILNSTGVCRCSGWGCGGDWGNASSSSCCPCKRGDQRHLNRQWGGDRHSRRWFPVGTSPYISCIL